MTCRTTFEDSRPMYRVLPSLDELRRKKSFSDVEIELSNGEICAAHRVLLAARIPALKEELLLDSSKRVLKWNQSGRLPKAATAILDYAYTGKLELATDTVEGILGLASDLGLGKISKWCGEFLYSILNLDNIHFVWNIARMGNMSSLARDCIRKMQVKFQDYIRRDSFTKLSVDALIPVVRSEDLNVQTEDQVVLAISQWTSSPRPADQTERLSELLREVRWNAVSNDLWKRTLGDRMLAEIFPHFSDYMKECEAWCRNAKNPLILCPFNQKARFYNNKLILLIGFDHCPEHWQYTFAFHDVNKPGENKIICKRMGRRYASAVAFRDKVVIIGGTNPYASNKVTIFDVPTKRVKPAARMNFFRIECAATRCGDFILAFGGMDHNWNYHATCELFRPSKNEWKQLPISQTARRAAAMVSLDDGRVFILGGGRRNIVYPLVECATLPTDDRRANEAGTSVPFWRCLAPMHEARMGLSACVLNGRIFVAGGVNCEHRPLQSVEYFVPPDGDSAIGHWTVMQCMNQTRDTFSLLALEQRLYAFGADSYPGNTVECLGPPDTENPTGSRETDSYDGWQWSTPAEVSFTTTVVAAMLIL